MNAIEKHILSGTLSQYSREQERTLNIYKISCWVLFALMLIFGLKYLSYKTAYQEAKKQNSKAVYKINLIIKELQKADNYIQSVQPKGYKLNN